MNIKGFGNITWMTNLPVQHRKLVLKEEYDPVKYPKYDNYEAIEVGRVEDIPMDYDGVMGVPLTIIQYDLDNVKIIGDKTINGKDTKIDGKEKYRRVLIKKNFEILGMAVGNSAVNGFGSQAGYTKHKKDRGGCPLIDGKIKYGRVFIKRK